MSVYYRQALHDASKEDWGLRYSQAVGKEQGDLLGLADISGFFADTLDPKMGHYGP
jgi:hypothetical protein